MLYHVPDPADAVTELRRILAPGGRLYVVLNAQDHLGELRNAVQQARYEAGSLCTWSELPVWSAYPSIWP